MYIVSWSGGKDSCLACYKAIKMGYKISHLMNFITAEYQRVALHGIRKELIQKQAESIGLPLVQKEVISGPESNYEMVFKETIRVLLPGGIKGLVCGDIYLQEHKQWLEARCAELGIELVEPLWGMRTEDIMDEFLNAGFQSLLVSARPESERPQTGLPKEWIGKIIDRDFVQYLKKHKPYIDLCGEGGEYHTFVINGPLFKKKIEIKQTAVVEKQTPYGPWYFLDIQKYD